MQVAPAVLNSRVLDLPPADATVQQPSSRGSLTFPILGNAGLQPHMRQLRIVPAATPDHRGREQLAEPSNQDASLGQVCAHSMSLYALGL